jgi:dienelactone hydrolase
VRQLQGRLKRGNVMTVLMPNRAMRLMALAVLAVPFRLAQLMHHRSDPSRTRSNFSALIARRSSAATSSCRELPIRRAFALQGWSNGASATLATMSSSTPALNTPTPATGFRGAVAFYPGCGLDGHTAATRDATADAKAFLAALLKRK